MVTIPVAIAGAGGRMGQALIEAILAAHDLELAGALEHKASPQLGRDAGERMGQQTGVAIVADVAGALVRARVLIDFTRPEGTLEHLTAARARHCAMVIGTTGFSAAQKEQIRVAAQEIAIVMAPNMSVGVNVLFAMVRQAARALGDAYDVEIVELHHKKKKDAPSGTAMRLAEVAAEVLGRDPARDLNFGRHGLVGERPAREIGVQTLRGGDAVGEHTVYFVGEGERLELTHRATSRDQFARGAVRAARWVVGRPPGLHDMADVLGLGER